MFAGGEQHSREGFVKFLESIKYVPLGVIFSMAKQTLAVIPA